MPTVAERLLEKIQLADNGCWVFSGCKTEGYGLIKVARRLERAHRVAYAEFVGPIPTELQLDHVWERGCRSRACSNPEHLEPVTPKENIRRERSRRAACPLGHPYDDLDNRGGRICRTCRRMANRRHYWKKVGQKK